MSSYNPDHNVSDQLGVFLQLVHYHSGTDVTLSEDNHLSYLVKLEANALGYAVRAGMNPLEYFVFDPKNDPPL